MAPPPPAPPPPSPPPPSPPLVTLKVLLIFLRVFTAVLLLIALIVLSTNSVTIVSRRNAVKLQFDDVYAYRYMLSATVIGLVYAIVQLFFTFSQLASEIKNPFNYQLDFYGDKVISYLVATGSAAGFGVTKDLKDIFKVFVALDDPLDEFFSKAYASASLLLLAFICLAVLSVFSSFAIAKRT